MLDTILRNIKKIIPLSIYSFFQPAYHISLALFGATLYRFPSRSIKVIAVTGTKGKSSVTEIINTILENAGKKTAVSNTIRFKIGDNSKENLYKMSMPGRFAVQKFLRNAVNGGCEYAIVEMTSQGAQFFRHRYIDLDALVVTNISPEHIEAHGSYENYVQAKLSIAQSLSRSKKANTLLVVNSDDREHGRFLSYSANHKVLYSLKDVEPYVINKDSIDLVFRGIHIHSPLSGLFNLYNILASATTVENLGIDKKIISETLETFREIPGRVQKIDLGQDFNVVVDYAHTADSLEKFYKIFTDTKNICVLGGTGGGRDTWKRQEMGKIADRFCNEIILTNEDPYDEDPMNIINDVAKGITNHKPSIIVDRREAIREALRRGKEGCAVLITGKGTDPYIMGKNGSKLPWSDKNVTEEELRKII